MLSEISYDETHQELIFFVGECDYQQELSKRGFGTVLQERKFGISATMIRENPSKLLVTECEPGEKGNTAQGATKPCIVETGAQVMVPLFVNEGDTLKIDTRTGEYSSRV